MELERHPPRSGCRIGYFRIASAEREASDYGNRFSRKQHRAAEGGRVGGPHKLACRARAFDVIPALARMYAEGAFEGVDHLRGIDLRTRSWCAHGQHWSGRCDRRKSQERKPRPAAEIGRLHCGSPLSTDEVETPIVRAYKNSCVNCRAVCNVRGSWRLSD